MKKFTLLVAITIITTFSSFAQQDKNIENLTTGKWNIEFVEIENEVINVKDEGHWMVFHPDGMYQIILDNEEQVGTWNINDDLEMNFDDNEANGKSTLKEIKDNKLKFSISGYTIALAK